MEKLVVVDFINCKPRICETFTRLVEKIVEKGVGIPDGRYGAVVVKMIEEEPGKSAYSVVIYETKKNYVVEVTLASQNDIADQMIEDALFFQGN